MNRHVAQALQSRTNPPTPAWRTAGRRYHNLSFFYRQKFGGPVWKIPLDAGFGCPNADGTLSRFGCTFCNIASFSPARRHDAPDDVTAQLIHGIAKLRRQKKAERFIAYFQAGTNTYADCTRLDTLFREALQVPGVVGFAVGTRPDCLPNEILDLLQDFARRTWLSLEIGLQSANDTTLRRINRGHGFAEFRDAVLRSHARGLDVCVHVMLGLPGETPDDARATMLALSELPISGVKFHNTYVSKNTTLARLYEAGMYRPLAQEAYVETLIDCLELLSPHCVVERLTAETTDEFLIAPEWCRDKNGTLRLLERRLIERDTWQGKKLLRPGANSSEVGTP
ncbi:TIGR01212 family radical SAM protein [Thermopirellula anaerolimosa]